VGGMSEIEQLKSSNNRAKLRLDLFNLLRFAAKIRGAAEHGLHSVREVCRCMLAFGSSAL
jgi:hypothetical protein